MQNGICQHIYQLFLAFSGFFMQLPTAFCTECKNLFRLTTPLLFVFLNVKIEYKTIEKARFTA